MEYDGGLFGLNDVLGVVDGHELFGNRGGARSLLLKLGFGLGFGFGLGLSGSWSWEWSRSGSRSRGWSRSRSRSGSGSRLLQPRRNPFSGVCYRIKCL